MATLHEQPKHRGVIIVDTNVLYDLRAEVPKEFTGGLQTHKRFMDILPFLGKNGFDILIPEEVVYEITQHVVVNEGKTLKNIAPYLEEEHRLPPRHGFARAFGNALHDKMPGVHILSSANLTIDTAHYMRRLQDAVEEYPEHNEAGREAVQFAWRSDRRKGLGDKAISAHVRRFAQSPEMPVIFDLSTDRKHELFVAEHHHHDPKVKILDTAGLMKAMADSNLLHHALGVDEHIPYQAIMEHITQARGRYLGDRNSKPNGFRDSSCEFVGDSDVLINDKPFSSALQELAKDLAHTHQKHENRRNGSGDKYVSKLTGHTGNGVHVPPKTDTPMSF